jgi:uncharacterized phage-associated protein
MKKEFQPIDVNLVAQYFINRACLDARDGRGEFLSLAKLHKLLYFTQGCHGAINNTKIFDGDFVHKKNGPEVVEIAQKYVAWGLNGIAQRNDDIEIDNESQMFLENIYLIYGQYSTWRLSEMIFNELPWSTTKENEKIDYDGIVKYFKIYHDDRLTTLKMRDKRIMDAAISLRDRGILDDAFIIKHFYKYN